MTMDTDDLRKIIQPNDLRPYSDGADLCLTTVDINYYGDTVPWLQLGRSRLMAPEGTKDRTWRLSVMAGRNAQDETGSRALILRLPLVGVEIEFIYGRGQRLSLSAFVGSSVDLDDDRDRSGEFRVLAPGVDPFAGAPTEGADNHPVIPYLPPFDKRLYRIVRGLQVSISIGLAPEIFERE
jgi:hypothetical protein